MISPDPIIVSLYGETVIHKPRGVSDEFPVQLVRDDTERLQSQGALLVFFGTMADSGFDPAHEPDKDDVLEVDGSNYRVYDVKSDWAGGTHATRGLHIYLTQAEA